MPSDITMSDIIALLLFLLSWYSISWLSGHFYSKDKTTLYSISKSVRNQWMLHLLSRENRISDVALLGHLIRSASFFASTSLLVLASFITVFGVLDDAIKVTSDIPFAQHVSASFWKLKLLLMVIIFIFVFFKLVWSIRQYNATIIMVGAAPSFFDSDTELYSYANSLGIVINRASRHFIDGMRGFEFSLAALAWFIHPVAFIFATIIVSLVTYRREFASKTLKAMSYKKV
jgi:uncharacterized membrane protein